MYKMVVFLKIIIFCCFLVISDLLIARRPFFTRNVWAIYDVFVHSIVALFVAYPVLESTKWSKLYILSAIIAGTFIDIDHVIAAHSISLKDLIALPIRPVSHSILFSFIVALFVALASRNYLLGYIFLIGLLSHVLRDASGGSTPILWPIGTSKIPLWIYYFSLLVIFALSKCVSIKFLQK